MKNPTFVNIALIVSVLFSGLQLYAQNFEPFAPRFNDDLKGDIVLIGNNILGPDNNAFNDDTTYNHNVDMQYIDIDGDTSTFSSSSSDLDIPNPNCYRIRYAGLYWGAVNPGDEPIDNVRFKGPTGGYNDIQGNIIYDANGASVDGGSSFSYACYADVTAIVTAFGSGADLGTYTVANVSSGVGETSTFDPYNGTGHSAGWSLFVVYEDPTLPGKSITSFDGFSAISASENPTANILVDGFRTVPAPAPVRANFAFATLEGDSPIQGDRLLLNGTALSTLDRPVDNFFNSSVTQLDATPVNNRVPNSTNTLGFDTGVMVVPNPGNSVIANDATSATVTLETDGDTYFQYFFALAVDIIEPNIVLTKIVEDDAGNDIGGQTVGLGAPLNYVIGFQNTGNDNATSFQIRDILPINITFDYPTDLVLPAGVTVASYDPITREIIFDIEDYLVEENDPVYEIRIEANVVDSCGDLADACSNIINNQAFATYNGFFNPTFQITDDPSLNSNTGCLLSPQATNFLADLDCQFIQNQILCGASLEMTAANGYDSYSWSTSPTGAPVIGTNQTITVTETGTYYVFNTAIAPCQSITQEFVVELFGGDIENPIIPYADEVVTCPNDGKLLPNIFLCGANDFRDIQTNITGATSIIWEQLDESSCTPVTDPDCANEDGTCTWNEVATGPDFLANAAGQFRLTINYDGGCFVQFYFNVYQNLLNPTVVAEDIICTTPGSITVNNVPSGYEYSLDNITFQTSNIFTINTAGNYTVYVRQIGVPTNPCVFSVLDVQIRERDFTVSTTILQPLCNGDRGSILLAANDVDPQYSYELYESGTLVNSVGPILENTYIFENLNPGIYTATVETENGCTYTEDFTITEPPLLTVTAAITIPLTCLDGEITVYPVGGTAPYFYFINGSTDFQTVPEIVVTTAGAYDIMVVDSNNCSASTTITIDAIPAPDFTITPTNITCASSGDTGVITVNVTNANGNSIEYSVDGGMTFFNSNVFTGLAAGSYDVVLQYTVGASVCVTDPQIVTITTSTPITGTADLTSNLTCLAGGTITVTGVTGGNTPYEYSIDGITFQTSNVFTGLTDGTYTVTIQDASNCTFITNQITIDPLDPPRDLMFDNSPITCPTNTSTVTITGTNGGTGTLEYQITAPAASATGYQTSNVFSGLAPGTYTFQVRDANDCVYSESYTIDPLPVLIVDGQNINDISCFGDLDGSIQFTVSGSTGFTYTINGGSNTSGTSPVVLTGLAAGNYTINVTDTTTNCLATDTITVNAPPAVLALTTTVSPITCIENGDVVINTTGGWGGNTYSITLPDGTVLPAQTSNMFVNLSQDGIYTATVVDANGCIATNIFNLSTPLPPTASISPTSDFCYDGTNGATIVVTASAGQAPYEYSINGGAFQTSNIFNNLVPGTYTIIARDSFGCEVALSTETIEPQLTLNTVLTKDLDCTASPDAIITGTISGGTAPFNYSISINGGGYTSLGTTASPFTYTSPTDGTYQFQVIDALGCIAESNIITVDPITPPALSAVVETRPVLCNGDSNGGIDITIDTTVGTAPFTINVNNDTTGTNYGTQTSGLTAGSYTITITDANSCTGTETIIINEPDPIILNYNTVDITCTASGVSQGSVIVNSVTGGTAPYNYFVTGTNGYSNSELNNTGSTSVSFDVVDFGLYQINVVDANGCSVLEQDILVASPPTDLDISITSTIDCLLGGEAVISVGSTLSSAGPFFFSIYEGPTTVYPVGTWLPEDMPGSQSATFTGLISDVAYTFIVFDASTNCSYYEPATTAIPTNSTLTLNAVSSNNITCTGSADGNVSFTINSVYPVATNVSYEIFDSLSLVTTGITGTGIINAGGTLTVTDLGPLPFGNYFVSISETSGPNSGCGIVTAPFNITESAFLLELATSVDQNANCNPNSGVISAVAQNGTAPYLYQITTTATAPLATDSAWASASIFNADAGNYFVHVIDAYGCIISSPVVVLPMDPTPIIAATLNNQCTAVEGAFEIDITLPTAGIAPYSFSIDGGTFQTQIAPFTISNLSSGTHTIEVQDANGCGNLVSVDIIAPVGLSAIITELPSCTNDDGELTITGSGGTGTFTYTISPNPASVTLTGNVFSGIPSGTYTVTMTDTTTTCTSDVTVTLGAATPVTFTTNVTDVSCNGDSNGAITVYLPPTNDNPVYTYEITAPIVVPSQNSNVFTGLPAGTYTVQVNSGRGCSETADATIGEPILLQVSGTATDFACVANNTVNTSTITITELGGTSPYTYSIDGTNYFTANTFDIIDNGSIQNITVYTQDANGCAAANTVTVNPLPTITTAAVAISSPIDCNNTGAITITVTGGSSNLTYQMLPSGTPQASNIFNITIPGDYYFQVNDVDTGCSFATTALTVAPFNTITATTTENSVVTCFGDNSGAFDININGYSGAYTYDVLDSSATSVTGVVNANTSTNPLTVSGMQAGVFTVVITETTSPFCSVISSVIITSPTETLTLVANETSNVTCDNDQGTITAFGNGGWGNLEYELTGAVTVAYSSNGTFTGLSAGNYTVNVRDAEGCIVSENIILTVPTPINATFTPSTNMLSCFEDQNAAITITNVTGGEGANYTYTLNSSNPSVFNSGPQTSNVFTGLSAGTYSVTINDGFNCFMTSIDMVINEPTPIQASLVTATTQSCLVESTLTLSASGGTGPYTYSATSTFTTVLGSFVNDITFSVPVGTYEYFVRDANGCIANISNEITIDPLLDLEINLESTNPTINCAGDNNGTIVATAQGGLGNYVYTLEDTIGNTITATQDSPGVFTELVAGTYVVNVVSNDCIEATAPITITEPTAPLDVNFTVNDITCSGSEDGVLEITATGGTGIIKYAISPQLDQFFDTNIFENLAPGNYDVIVQDVLGCYVTFDFIITDPIPVILSIVPNSIFEETCEGDANGEFSIDISGGSLPYSVSLDDIDGTYTVGGLTQTEFEFLGLNGGDHIVYVRDAQGCESEWNITFPEAVRINPIVEIEYLCTNDVLNNTVTVIVDESITDLSQLDYSLDGGAYQVSNIFTNVPSGADHFIDVRHSNGCIQTTAFFTIEDYQPLSLILAEGNEPGEIIANATGGTGDYVFTLNNENYGSTNTFIVTQIGIYTVVVTDSAGCQTQAVINIEILGPCIANYFTPNGDNVQDTWAPGCVDDFPDLTFDIFDRYGRKVATYRVGEYWDGRYNGKELPTGDYWYVVKTNSSLLDKEYVGHFTLYR